MDKAALIRHGNAAWQWWCEGMWLLVPQTIRERWFPPRAVLEMRLQGDELVLGLREGATVSESPKRLPLGGSPVDTETVQWLADSAVTDSRVILFLPETRVLSRTLQLPLAVEPDLLGMLELELDRLTPFTPNAVYVAAGVIDRNAQRQILTCRFAVVRKKDVDPILGALSAVGRPAESIQIEPAFEVPLDLLPPALRPQGNREARQRTVAAWGAAVALLLLALYAPLPRQTALLSQWQQTVAAQRETAGEAQSLLAQRTSLSERARFIANRRAGSTPVVAVLSELTQRLPDTAWVNRLMVQGEDVQLFGEAGSATSLVSLLEASDLFEAVDFRSPTTRNEATGKDRFHLGLRLAHGKAAP